MDTQIILDSLLKSGKELYEKGKTLAEERLNIPDGYRKKGTPCCPVQVKGRWQRGAMAVLLGTSAGRKLTGRFH